MNEHHSKHLHVVELGHFSSMDGTDGIHLHQLTIVSIMDKYF
jgi:hypothetical protein